MKNNFCFVILVNVYDLDFSGGRQYYESSDYVLETTEMDSDIGSSQPKTALKQLLLKTSQNPSSKQLYGSKHHPIGPKSYLSKLRGRSEELKSPASSSSAEAQIGENDDTAPPAVFDNMVFMSDRSIPGGTGEDLYKGYIVTAKTCDYFLDIVSQPDCKFVMLNHKDISGVLPLIHAEASAWNMCNIFFKEEVDAYICARPKEEP